MTKKRIHKIYGIVLSAVLIIAGICLIAACVGIYLSGDKPFSPASVAAAFSGIAIPVYLCLALIVGGLILDGFFPEEVKKLPAEKLIEEANTREEEFNVWYRIPPRKGDTKIALDEWNIWNSAPNGKSKYGLIQDYTWMDALWVGSFLNLLINHSGKIGIANMAQLVNVIAPIMAEKDGSYCQTTYYPMQLYRKLAGGDKIAAECAGLDIAATMQGGEVTAFIVNRKSEPALIQLPKALREATVLTGDAPNAINTLTKNVVHIDAAEGGQAEFTAPAFSLCILEL